jgi:metal-responsive CopG/Arc/MetJ family transcriptional regulator
MQKQRNVSISDEIIAKIDTYRKEFGISRSETIRQAILKFLGDSKND